MNMKKKISKLLVALILSVCCACFAEEIGLKLQGSGACINSCTKYAMGLSVVGNDKLGEHMRGTDKETKLAGTELVCAINQVGRNCLDNMRKQRKDRVKIHYRNGKKEPIADYMAIDYIACVYGRYNPSFSTCKYK